MTKRGFGLLGAAVAALVCAGSAAKAQDDPYRDRWDSYYDSARSETTDSVGGETVLVYPGPADRIQRRRMVGRINGEINPSQFSLSRPVDISGLDPRRSEDYAELRARVAATARDVCADLHDSVSALRDDPSSDRQCVIDATRNAMRDVRTRVD